MGFPFTKVDLVYFEDKADESGYKKETSRIKDVDVIWNGNLTLGEQNKYAADRYTGVNVDAEIKILFKNITKPTPNNCMVEKDGKMYKVLNIPDDLKSQLRFYVIGLEETKRGYPG